MTIPQKGDPARGWLWVEKLLVDDEVERIERLSDEQVLAEMGLGPSHVASADRLMKKANERSAQPRRPARAFVWLVAAAFVLAIALVAKRDEIATALRGHPPVSPLQQPVPPPPGPSRQEVAAVARADAQKACSAGDLQVCMSKLDEARDIDPTGEEAPAVRTMRETIHEELEAKPRPRK